MKTIASLFIMTFLCAAAGAAELRVSSKEPIFVTARENWTVQKAKSSQSGLPGETFRLQLPLDRNIVCLISILGKNHEEFADATVVKKILRCDCRPYVSSMRDLPKVEMKELKIKGGLAFYANFIDPDLVGKPVKLGVYKVATPILLSLGEDYLIKATILCDDLHGTDYEEAMKIVGSIRVVKR